jgi:thiamine transport system permease protein
LQALGSAFFSVVLGLLISLGLVKVNSRFRSLFLSLAMIPSIMPALLSILIVLAIVNPFPSGVWGIIITHTFIFSGFAAVHLFQLIKEQSLGLIEVSYVLGASRFQTYREVIRMLQDDILSLGFIIFTIAFASFSVPIAVGGGQGITLEILIYEKIRMTSDWGQAVGISIFQIMILFLFSLFQSRKLLTVQSFRPVVSNSFSWFGHWFGLLALFVYAGMMFGGVIFFSFNGWIKVYQMTGLFGSVLNVLPSTLSLGLLVAAFSMFLLLMTAYLNNVRWLQKILKGLVAPSLSLIGFSIILLKSESSMPQIFFYTLGFSIFIFPALYRFGFDSVLTGIHGQIEVARVLGANENLIFKDIIFPQVFPAALRLGGLAVIWQIGDFALARYVFTEEKVMGQIIYSLLNSFRIDQGMAIMSFNLILGILIYYLFARLSDVFSEKS